LAEVRQQRNRLEKLSRWALAVVLVCGALTIAAAFLASPAEKRWTRPPPPFDWDNAPAEVPRVAGVHWLERNPAVERALRLAGWLGLLLLPLLVLGLLTLYLWMRAQAGAAAASEVESKLSQLGIVLLLSGILLIPLVPVMWKALQQLRNRLGTDGRRLYIRLHDGREIAADPAQLLYTDRAIIYREHSLPLMGGKQRPFYQPGEVETWLGPLLRQANKLSATEALRYQWRHRDSGLLWRLAVALVLAAVLIVTLMAL
jgi:hypothetical protein